MKSFSKTLLAVYLLVLLWLVLFKFSYNLLSVLMDYQTRSLNLVPFAGITRANFREMIDNVVVFIPFGLLLGVNLKRMTFGRKLTLIFMVSFAAELAQYVFAIGRTDVTDVIMNTLGGLAGLMLYDASQKHIDSEKLDRFIVVTGSILLVILILLRVLVFRVRY